MAKNAAIVSLGMNFGTYPKTYSTTAKGSDHHSDHIWEDIPPVHNYIQRMIDDIHCEGALVYYVGSIGGGGGMPGGGSSGGGAAGGGAGPQVQTSGGGAPQSGGGPGGSPPGGSPPGGAAGGGSAPGGAGPQSQSSVSIEDIVAQAKDVKDQGYDVMTISGNNLEQVEAVRNATNLILIAKLSVGGGMSMRGEDFTKYKWNYPGIEYDWQFGDRTPGIDNTHLPTAAEIEQAVENAKKLDGMADIFWIRDGRCEHPNGYIQNKEKPFNLAYAEAIKKAGVKTYVCPSAGFHIAEQNDQFIANGQMDMVGMTTPFFADAEYIKKAYEGRFEDIVPCLMCHDCHGTGRLGIGPFYSTCSVNPKWGTPGYKIQNIQAPTVKKRVAVIGGGPGGMKAALTAAERGHKVTLYEKDSSLGGLLKFTDYTEWKWTYKDYKDEKGEEKSIPADSVVIYSGLKPRTDEAMKFSGAADQVLLLGDCTGKNGNIQKTIRSAFFVASQV